MINIASALLGLCSKRDRVIRDTRCEMLATPENGALAKTFLVRTASINCKVSLLGKHLFDC
jgi:hypothetical protein